MTRNNTLLTLCIVLPLVAIQSGCGDTPAVNDPASTTGATDSSTEVRQSPAHAEKSASATSAGQDMVPPEHCYFHKDEQPHAAEWGYEGDTSPEHWGELSPEYALAETGRRQSPIDIVGAVPAEPPETAVLEFAYGPSRIDLVYNGHTVEEVEDHKSYLNADGERFVLEQFHFHSPSEHTIDGRHSAMEMHLVHEHADGRIVVVGVMIEEGSENPAFDQVWDYLPSAENRERKETATVDASTLLPEARDYFGYTGSFTTPPCTEGVFWIILKTPVELSPRQIESFRVIIHGNNRPVQPLNDRRISVSR